MPRTLSAREHLKVADRHLEDHVRLAWDDPTDWDDLALYGFYCLEAAIMAASTHLGWTTRGQHPDKARAAERLATERGLPDIQQLLTELNDGRKAVAYGDLDMPELNPAEVITQIEGYIAAVAVLIGDDGA
jgi:hypothetical protein